MKREILFRGYQRELKKWVYGDLIHAKNGGAFIFSYENNFEDRIEVDPESVGQLTGFKDKNGTRLFEGDFCTFDLMAADEQPAINNDRGEVSFGGIGWARMAYCTNIKKIGNIFDNPELLKKSSHHLQM